MIVDSSTINTEMGILSQPYHETIPPWVRATIYIVGVLASGVTMILNGFDVITAEQHAAIMSGLAAIMGGLAAGHLPPKV